MKHTAILTLAIIIFAAHFASANDSEVAKLNVSAGYVKCESGSGGEACSFQHGAAEPLEFELEFDKQTGNMTGSNSVEKKIDTYLFQYSITITKKPSGEYTVGVFATSFEGIPPNVKIIGFSLMGYEIARNLINLGTVSFLGESVLVGTTTRFRPAISIGPSN
jgi:hypothetical protein